MQIPVTTKVESAWYVKPELLAGVEADSSKPVPKEASRPNETMTLTETDLEESEEGLSQGLTSHQTGVRKYRSVALKGALLAPDENDQPLPSEELLVPFGWRFQLTSIVRQISTYTSHFESGRIPPAQLAFISFSAGVATTLLGVIVAL